MKKWYFLASISLCLSFNTCFPLYLKYFGVTYSWNIFPLYTIKSSLFGAAYSGNLGEVNEQLALNPNVEEKDIRNFTPAHYSATQGHTDCLKALLYHDASATQRVANQLGDKGRSPLHCAAFEGHAECVKALLDAGAKIDIKDEEGLSPLHYASLKGKNLCVKLLLEHDRSLTPKLIKMEGPGNITPLHCAACSKDAASVKLLLENQSSIFVKDEKELTPIHYAIFSNGDETECLSTLLEHRSGSKIDQPQKANDANNQPSLVISDSTESIVRTRSNKGLTPVHCAAGEGKINRLKLLLRNVSKSLELPSTAKDSEGKTPLHYAAQWGHYKIVDELLKNGGNPLLKDDQGKVPLHYAVISEKGRTKRCVELLLKSQAKEQLNQRDKNGNTPLHCLRDYRGEGTVHLLLAKGAKVTTINNDGEDPLHCACREGATFKKERFRENIYQRITNGIVEALLENYHCSFHINGSNNKGETPYTLAAGGEHGSVIISLLEKKGGSGIASSVPLYRAVAYADLEQVQFFLQKQTPINKQYFRCRTLLHCAILTGCTEVIKLLLAKGADVNARDEGGDTPLHYAAAQGSLPTLKLLLLKGSNILKTDIHDRIPLQIAALRGHHTFVRALLLADTADLQKTFLLKKGYSPLHLAIYQNDLIEVLKLTNAGLLVDEELPTIESPLTLAVACGSVNALRILLRNLVNVNVNGFGSRRCTLLHLAAVTNHDKVIDVLLEMGADTTIPSVQGLLPLELAVIHGKTKSTRRLLTKSSDSLNILRNGTTLLHLAARKDQIKIIEILLAHGADHRVHDSLGLRPLERAVKGGCVGAARILLAKENSDTLDMLNKDMTLLHLAASSGQEEIIKLLFEHKVNQSPVNEKGNDPLHLAAAIGHVGTVEALLKRVPRDLVAAKNYAEKTAYEIAVAKEHRECAKLLGKALAKVTTGQAPLERAIEAGHLEGVLVNLKKLTNINQRFGKNLTLLHLAAATKHAKIVKILLDSGIDVNAKTENEATAFHFAALIGSHEIIGLLLEQDAQPDMPFLKKFKGGYPLRKFVRTKMYEIQAKKKSAQMKDTVKNTLMAS